MCMYGPNFRVPNRTFDRFCRPNDDLLALTSFFSGLGEGMLACYLVLLCCASLVHALMCSETIDTGRAPDCLAIDMSTSCDATLSAEDADKRASVNYMYLICLKQGVNNDGPDSGILCVL